MVRTLTADLGPGGTLEVTLLTCDRCEAPAVGTVRTTMAPQNVQPLCDVHLAGYLQGRWPTHPDVAHIAETVRALSSVSA